MRIMMTVSILCVRSAGKENGVFNYLKEYFNDWNWWDWSWTVVASITGVWLGVKLGAGDWNTVLSIVTCLTGLWCVILVAKGRIFNYYLGIINVIGYAYIAYQYKLYGEVMLNIGYFLPMQFVGLYIWSTNKDYSVKDKVIVKFLSNEARIMWFMTSIVAIIVYATVLTRMGDPYPWLDSTSTILSIAAMILMAWRCMEQWVLWIVVDIVSVAMWYCVLYDKGANDVAILVMWSAYLINAVYGLVMWINMYKKQEERTAHV